VTFSPCRKIIEITNGKLVKREAFFDRDGNLVTNDYNRGTYNYFSNENEPIKKIPF
jgi:hypothetical protein